MKKSELKRTKGLKKGKARGYNTTLRAKTKKTADRNREWQKICLWRINFLIEKYGFIICEYCGKKGVVDKDDFNGVWGHHIDGDRNNTDLTNCYICHTATCHSYITDHNVQVTQEDFKKREMFL